MAANTNIEVIGINPILRKFFRMEHYIPTEELMGLIGEEIMTRIKVRTAAGKDVELHPFKGYSAGYKLFREEHGRPTDIVDLNFYGDMWKALTHKATKRSVHVFFMNTPDTHSKRKKSKKGGKGKTVTNAAKAFFLNEDRHFFALNDEDVEKIKEMVRRYAARGLTGA